MEEYKQYETAELIQQNWNEPAAIGDTCTICHLNDAPIVWRAKDGTLKCKWCAEKDNLDYHLNYNGERRLAKTKSELRLNQIAINVAMVIICVYLCFTFYISMTH